MPNSSLPCRSSHPSPSLPLTVASLPRAPSLEQGPLPLLIVRQPAPDLPFPEQHTDWHLEAVATSSAHQASWPHSQDRGPPRLSRSWVGGLRAPRIVGYRSPSTSCRPDPMRDTALATVVPHWPGLGVMTPADHAQKWARSRSFLGGGAWRQALA